MIKATLTLLVLCGSLLIQTANASIVYRFENAQIPDADFKGVEAFGFHVSFGPDILEPGDVFSLRIGTTAGGNDLAERLNWSFDMDVEGFGFGDTLNLIPTTDVFYAAFEVVEGAFNVSSVRAGFSIDEEVAIFDGVRIRDIDDPSIEVPEPSTYLLVLIGLVLCQTMHRRLFVSSSLMPGLRQLLCKSH